MSFHNVDISRRINRSPIKNCGGYKSQTLPSGPCGASMKSEGLSLKECDFRYQACLIFLECFLTEMKTIDWFP